MLLARSVAQLHAHSGLDAVRLQGPGLLEDGELTTSLVLFEADGSGRKLDMRSMPEQVSMSLRLQLAPSQQDHLQLLAWQSPTYLIAPSRIACSH